MTEHNLEWSDLRTTDGRVAQLGDTLLVHYEAYRADDELVESSWQGEPFKFVLGQGQVIKALDQALIGARQAGERLVHASPQSLFGHRGLDRRVHPDEGLTIKVWIIEIDSNSA